VISKNLYREWKDHPVTEMFFKTVEEITEDIEHAMLNGHSVESHPIIAQQLGLIRAYRSVLEYQPEFNDDGYMVDELGDLIE
jgi:hypothetical protein